MKKYKIENLVVLYIYRYDSDINKMKLCDFKITTKNEVRGVRFGYHYVKALDGVSYETGFSYERYCALKVEPLLTFLDIEKAKDIKKITYFDIVSLEKEMWNKRIKEIKKEEDNLPEAKDLF